MLFVLTTFIPHTTAAYKSFGVPKKLLCGGGKRGGETYKWLLVIIGNMNQNATQKLKQLGLTDYEAKTFIALYKIEEGTASQIAKVSKVPRASVYEVLRSLERKGAIIIEQGKPLRYRLLSLDSALENLEEHRKKEIKKMSDDLEDAKESIIESLADAKVKPQIEEESFWTIRGDEKVVAKIREVIKSAKFDLVVGAGDFLGLLDDLKEAEKNGIKVSVLVPPEVNEDLGLSNVYAISKEWQHKWHSQTDYEGEIIPSGILVVADHKECVISTAIWDEKKEPLRERTCLWAKSEGLAEIFSLVLNVIKRFGKKG